MNWSSPTACVRQHTLTPSTDLDDLETALCLKKCDWARTRLAGQRYDDQRERYDRDHYRCGVCSEVHLPAAPATPSDASSPTAPRS